jgi:hypothetical protein
VGWNIKIALTSINLKVTALLTFEHKNIHIQTQKHFSSDCSLISQSEHTSSFVGFRMGIDIMLQRIKINSSLFVNRVLFFMNYSRVAK